MELYNFFTEMVFDDEEKFNELIDCFEELKPICHHVQLVEFSWPFGDKKYFSIIGQMYGDDTNLGDLDLLVIFSRIKYSWVDAFCHKINNIQ